MGAGEVVIGLVILVFFVAAALMGMAKPWEHENEPLEDLGHVAEDPTDI